MQTVETPTQNEWLTLALALVAIAVSVWSALRTDKTNRRLQRIEHDFTSTGYKMDKLTQASSSIGAHRDKIDQLLRGIHTRHIVNPEKFFAEESVVAAINEYGQALELTVAARNEYQAIRHLIREGKRAQLDDIIRHLEESEITDGEQLDASALADVVSKQLRDVVPECLRVIQDELGYLAGK